MSRLLLIKVDFQVILVQAQEGAWWYTGGTMGRGEGGSLSNTGVHWP